VSEELVRVSDADREHAVASLREHLVQGRLSLQEFTQRMEAAYGATTSTGLAQPQRDLPATAPERRRSALRFLVSIFGGARRSGSLRPVAPAIRVNVFVAFGGAPVSVKEST
jgi:hypothetical protein